MTSAKDIANRIPITVGLLLGSMLVSIDTTIANVALPHMQGSFSTSRDQTSWVLTFYIVGTAIMTPLGGWLASRVGYKLVFLVSIGGFTIASLLCGLSTNLFEIVAFRFAQGVFGASLQPLAQAVMLDLYPPREIGQVMAMTGAIVVLAPITGPVLGGWLTDSFSWRWVFFINLPIGILAFAAIWLFMSGGQRGKARPFDFLGFGALALFIVSLQLMLDRGATLDWFSSTEVQTEAVISAIALYVFVVQTVTSPHPFFDRALVADTNYLLGSFFSAAAAILLFSTMALQPPLMQDLMGYSVMGAGLLMAPRGAGSLISMLVAGRLVGRVDNRLILFIGLTLVAFGMWEMTHFNLAMDGAPFVTAGLLQGIGLGFIFIPMNTLAFATLAPRLRAEGAIVFALFRNIGQSVGISITEAMLTSQIAVAHSDLAAQVQPSNPVVTAGLSRAMTPGAPTGLVALNAEISRQASMVGYIDIFHLGLVGTLVAMPLVLILRPQKKMTVLETHIE
jgi:DHA2 family multidrug resistance protein